jgi:hypothetical protein
VTHDFDAESGSESACPEAHSTNISVQRHATDGAAFQCIECRGNGDGHDFAFSLTDLIPSRGIDLGWPRVGGHPWEAAKCGPNRFWSFRAARIAGFQRFDEPMGDA